MERSRIALIAAAALAFGPLALAQSEADRAAPPLAQTPDLQLTDADLEKFVDIYVDLQETADAFEAQLSRAKDEAEAQELQSRMEKESLDKVTKRGWTPQHYVTVARTINADPVLADKTLTLIGKH
jgi:hypothetical protein